MAMYKNSEGYADPTAGIALGQVMSDYKRQQRELWKRHHEMKNRRKVYVVSKYAGEVEKNVTDTIRYCRHVIDQGKMPVASRLLYSIMLEDSSPKERELGTIFGLALLAMCDEVWVFGKEHSKGMVEEIKEAKKLHKPIRYLEVI
nr:DUF4406 domain-containing protein [uncultured Niameybacter sp.]